MTIIRDEFAPEFMWGDDVVLLAMDGAGVAAFAAALKDAERQGTSQLHHGGVTHDFLIQSGEADIDLETLASYGDSTPPKLLKLSRTLTF
jgi:hypothetical protein